MQVVLLIAVFTLIIVVSVLPNAMVKKLFKRYGEEGAIADAYVEPDKPFHLAAPASGELELMLRFTVKRYRSGGSRVSRNLAILIDLRREPAPDAAGAYRDAAAVQKHRHEYLIGLSARAASDAATTRIGTTYAVRKLGSSETATAVLMRIPAGGALTIEGKLSHPLTTQLESATLFVKPVV